MSQRDPTRQNGLPSVCLGDVRPEFGTDHLELTLEELQTLPPERLVFELEPRHVPRARRSSIDPSGFSSQFGIGPSRSASAKALSVGAFPFGASRFFKRAVERESPADVFSWDRPVDGAEADGRTPSVLRVEDLRVADGDSILNPLDHLFDLPERLALFVLARQDLAEVEPEGILTGECVLTEANGNRAIQSEQVGLCGKGHNSASHEDEDAGESNSVRELSNRRDQGVNIRRLL